MLTIDEMQQMLEVLLDELPPELLAELNGGVNLREEECADPTLDEIYTLGEYVEDLLGRSIVLYYGSFVQLFEDSTRAELRSELRATLRHELRHHIESLAGVDDLGAEDEADMERFRAEAEAECAPQKAAQQAHECGKHEGERVAQKRNGFGVRLLGLFGKQKEK